METTAVILAETSERKKTKTRSEVSNDQADKRQMNQVRKSFNRWEQYSLLKAIRADFVENKNVDQI